PSPAAAGEGLERRRSGLGLVLAVVVDGFGHFVLRAEEHRVTAKPGRPLPNPSPTTGEGLKKRRRSGLGVVFAVVAGGFGHFVPRAEEYRHALVQLVRGDVEDALAAVGGGAAGLLDQQ